MSNGIVKTVIDENNRNELEPLKAHPKQFTLLKSSEVSWKSKAKKSIYEKIPILTWINDYNGEFAINDFISGITLGLTIIPESIACALLAGLPPFYGLCSVFIGSFIYLIFGTINTVIVGPTSLVALVTIGFTFQKPMEFHFILTFLAGVVELLMGILQFGFIFEFISMPVVKAFSTATAFLVMESQLKVLLGIKYLVPGFVQSIKTLISRRNEASLGDFLVGLFAMSSLFLLQYLGTIRIKSSKNSKFWNGFLRYLSLCRNTLVVLITATAAAFWKSFLEENEPLPFLLSKNSVHGLPNFTFPSFRIESEERSYDFLDILKELNFGIIVIPIIGLMTNISIGKLDPKGLVKSNQELLTLGLCNIVGSGVQSMPVSGAFTRAAISAASGIKTPMANLYSGIIVILALSFLSPYFNYIPKSTLAAILVCALFSLIDLKLPIRLWKESKRDFITWIICFTACIYYGVEVGLFVGIVVTVAHLLFLWARPEISVKIDQIEGIQYISLTPQNGIYFPAINYLREKVLKACNRSEFQLPVVIHCQKMNGLDFTAAQGFSKLCNDICSSGQMQVLILYEMKNNFKKFVDIQENLIFCENEEKLKEILLKSRNAQDHIDLGYKIDMENLEENY